MKEERKGTFPKRRYKYLYAKMLDENTIRKAWKNLRKGKTKRRAVQNIEAHFEAEVKAMQERIRNTKPEGYEVERQELAYEPPKTRRTKIVHEFGKKRTAHLAEIREQWYFHIIVEVLKPIMMGRLKKGVCGCIPGRGMHSGKKIVEKAIREGGIRNFFKCDIRHFYDNVRIADVIKQMRYLIDDELFLYCIEKIYKYQKKGILIGLYISPWISNFLLMHIDYAVTGIEGITYIRYVDDIVILGTSKKMLRKVAEMIRKMLGSIHLRLKRNHQICKFDYLSKKTRVANHIEEKIRIGRPIDFLGYVFFRNKTIVRKRIMIDTARMARMICRAKAEGRRIWSKLARGMISRMGWFTHADVYGCYLYYIKPYINVGKLKRIISKLDKGGKGNGRKLEEGNQLRAAG